MRAMPHKLNRANSGKGAVLVETRKIPRSIGRFFRDVWAELKRVAWPNRRQLQIYTMVVIASVFVVAAILSTFDFILAESLVRLFRR